MKKIMVGLNERSYDVFIGAGVISKLPGILAEISEGSPVVVITDKNVVKKAGKNFIEVIESIKSPVMKIVIEPGEKSKSLEVFSGVIKKIVSGTHGHKPTVVAVGGGVVGDLAGFVASAYRRGVPFLQVPTTLLAQVDSSVGGKVGIDLDEAKNIIGSFYQPRAVIADTCFLDSLSPRQIRNGMAEVIKYAVIKSPEMFEYLEKNINKINAKDKKFMEKIVVSCVEIKARVTEKDEFDAKDVRIILNFGHTLGHAVETASGYSDLYNHGESISLGMLMASEIAVRLGIFKKRDQDRLRNLIFSAGLPVVIKGVQKRKILAASRFDKKFTLGVNRFVLPHSIGRVRVVEDIPVGLIEKVVSSFFNG